MADSAADNPSALSPCIERAARIVPIVPALPDFVPANPLAELEDRPFDEAVAEARAARGGRGYPSAATFREAWQGGRIDAQLLAVKLAEAEAPSDPEKALRALEAELDALPGAARAEAEDRIDRVLSKWLTVFLDEGKADWPMPGRELGFCRAWRRVAVHDWRIPNRKRLRDAPDTAEAALEALVADYGDAEREAIFRDHLAALPGWAGRIKQRMQSGPSWQEAAPIELSDLLAVRTTLTELFGLGVDPRGVALDAPATRKTPIAEAFLSAWEQSTRQKLVRTLQQCASSADDTPATPRADWFLCIDTRSEPMRRHLERVGPHRTAGYAGFFGIPMRFARYDAERAHDACPLILDPKHEIGEEVAPARASDARAHSRRLRFSRVARKLIDQLKHNVGAAFHFVESAGPLYGAAMALRTLAPRVARRARRSLLRHAPPPDHFCAPALAPGRSAHGGLTRAEQVACAEALFQLTGWRDLAPFVVLVGHASESANNAFAAGLDCGACAGHAGGPNARVLAAIANDPGVRADLRERGMDIPPETVFVAAEHNTTTHELALYEQLVPAERRPGLTQLAADWERARAAAVAERAGADTPGAQRAALADTTRCAADWAETRPEWGLAGNAAFIVGPRKLTRALNLEGRCFLHSYDWRADPEGAALAGILRGPGVVTQWINNHYYFATVDNAVHGSGSKVTQSPVGNVGVLQGNGGDLGTGLPLQSVADRDEHTFHAPLRLTILVEAPLERVAAVLQGNPTLQRLVDHRWIGLTALDPERDHTAFDLRTERPVLDPAGTG